MDWNTLILEAATDARRRVSHLVGTAEARRSFGIGAGGDVTKKIDRVAEEAIIDALNRHNIRCTLMSEETGTKVIGEESDLLSS